MSNISATSIRNRRHGREEEEVRGRHAAEVEATLEESEQSDESGVADTPAVPAPTRSASKGDWADYVASLNPDGVLTPEQDKLTRDELAELVLGPKE